LKAFDESGLYPYQPTPAKYLAQLLESGQNCLDGSDCGVGKTAVASAIIRHLKLPTLVLTPQINIPNWEWMGKHLGVEFDVTNVEEVRTGKSLFGRWELPKPPGPLPTELRCTQCQLVVEPEKGLPCAYGEFHCVETKKLPHRYGKFFWHPGIQFLVLDECHKYCALDSLNADMAIAARRQGIRTLAISATAADSPLGLKALGYLLGLHSLVGEDSFYRFAFRFGCRKRIFGGLEFGRDDDDRKVKMQALHRAIFPSRGTRVRIEDLGDAFPECAITAELFDFGDAQRVNALYATMDEALAELQAMQLADKSPEHPFTKLIRARQALELLKTPLYAQLARDEVEAGNSVVIFVAFKATMDALCDALGVSARIEGGQSAALRDKTIQDYLDDKTRILVTNVDCGGTALNLPDVRGKFPRVGIASLVYSSRKMRQLFGRLRRITSKTKSRYRVILAGGTKEEKIHAKMTAKLDAIDLLNDGDLLAANLPTAVVEWPEGL